MDEGTSEARSVTRRRLVGGAVGTAAAVAAVAAVRVPTTDQKAAAAAHTAAGASAASADTGSLPKQDWVIYVRDANDGTLDVFVDTKHFTVRDSDLVARLIAAAK